MNSLVNKNSFFFFIDSVKDFETKYFKIDNFFKDSSLLDPNKYFSIFYNTNIDFDFLEKNEKMLSFFFIFNKFFFKDQLKNLKICLINECISGRDLEKKLSITFFLNFYFFFRHFYTFIFLLKKIALNKKNK